MEPGGEEEEEGGGGWSYESQVPVRVVNAHGGAVTTARLCCSDRCILSCSSDCSATLWDVESLQPSRTFSGVHSRTISESDVSPDGCRMVTVSWDRKMVAWDSETGHVSWKTKSDGSSTSCSFSADGRSLVTAAHPQHSVYVCSASGGQMSHHISEQHRSTVTRCRFDPRGQRVASVSADRTIKSWDSQALRTTVSISSNHSNVVSGCCFSGNGHFSCTASWDRTSKSWDSQGGQFRSRGGTPSQRGHEGSVSVCVSSADAASSVSGSYDRTVASWDPSSSSRTSVSKGHSDWVTDVSSSADRKSSASGSKVISRKYSPPRSTTQLQPRNPKGMKGVTCQRNQKKTPFLRIFEDPKFPLNVHFQSFGVIVPGFTHHLIHPIICSTDIISGHTMGASVGVHAIFGEFSPLSPLSPSWYQHFWVRFWLPEGEL